MSVDQDQGGRPLELAVDLTPSAIEAFLRVTGWEEADRREGVSAIWQLNNVGASLMLPYNPRYRDFPNRLNDALRTISEVYNIHNSEALALEIAGAQNDIIFLRADQYIADDSIPIREAQGLINGARKMLLAAACSAVNPKSSFQGRKPGNATKFIDEDVRMGHTSRGSFVLTLIARHEDTEPSANYSTTGQETSAPESSDAGETSEVAASGNDDSSTRHRDEHVESYTRRVMITLVNGLQATNALLQEGQSDIPLDEAVQLGVSAELLSSIEEMGDHPGLRALDVSFRWSPIQPAPPKSIPSRVVVPRPDKDRVKSIRSSILDLQEIPQDQVLGHVVRLERSEEQEEGTIVIDGYVGRTRHQVRVSLSGKNYQLAIRAHESRQVIVAMGTVARKNRSWWLVGDVSISLPLDSRLYS